MSRFNEHGDLFPCTFSGDLKDNRMSDGYDFDITCRYKRLSKIGGLTSY